MSQVTRAFERMFPWLNPEKVHPGVPPTHHMASYPHFPAASAPMPKDPYWYGRVNMQGQAFTGQPDKGDRIDAYPTPRGEINVVTPPEPPVGFTPTTWQLNFPIHGEESYKARLPPKRTRY